MTKTPLKDLDALGQSLWLDFVSKAIIEDGSLQKSVKNDFLKGVTSNPSIFESAIAHSSDYDNLIRDLALKGASESGEFFEYLAIKDIQDAADILRPVFEENRGADGFVSLEVSPHVAHNAKKTIEEAHRLSHAVNRPNLMIKVPGTDEGFIAVTELIKDGINVNITLLFSLESYKKSAHAYLDGLYQRALKGLPIDSVKSVASFFISRIDSKVDALLEHIISSSADGKSKKTAQDLLGKIAIANAKVAYSVYEEIYASEKARNLLRHGAMPQRLLWASTSTKNNNYSDVMYVESLIGKNTVNTLPPKTFAAFKDHGAVQGLTIKDDVFAAKADLKALASLGIDFDNVCNELLKEGIDLFSDAYDRLMQAITTKINEMDFKK